MDKKLQQLKETWKLIEKNRDNTHDRDGVNAKMNQHDLKSSQDLNAIDHMSRDFNSSDPAWEDVKKESEDLNEMPITHDIESRPKVGEWNPNNWMGEIDFNSEIGQLDTLSFVAGPLAGPFGGGNLFGIGVVDNENHNPDQPLVCGAKGIMTTYPTNEGPEKGPKLFEVATDPSQRKKGYARHLHDFILNKWGMVVSDNALFESSPGANDGLVGIWTKYLPSKYHMYLANSKKILGEWNGKIDQNEDTVIVALKYKLEL